ncbi:ABC transporter permease [Bacillus sp. B1-b2]|uniref:ABC transporter permease n=1 Tax=Bacillus sp. B1-b2 TaxID=2653201 RepID=UPI0012624938|nr:ABC transporter permease [Bacillus sp. B1-b2]KAB7664119.1 ABC transporter permease [Bacillus sp. B1-b2]
MFKFDAGVLWRERFSQTAREYSRYLKYILNGHLVIVLVFLLGTGAFYYQAWLKTISQDFPVAPIMSIILAFFVTKSPIYTFLKNADRIFLISVETKMKRYIHQSMVISFLIQGYILLMLLAVLMPLYAVVHEGDFSGFWYLLVVLLVAKGINLLIRWHIQYYVDPSYHLMDTGVRFLINLVLLYLLFADASLMFIVALLALLFFLLLYFMKATSHKGLKWEYLIEQDEKRLASFYRFANMFTEVPALRDRMKRRHIMDVLLNRIPYKTENVFTHLYWRTYIRLGDYFGLTIRLTVISGLFIFFLSYGPGQVFISVLFLFLTGLQLLPLWNAYDNKLWVRIYPIDPVYRKRAFEKIMRMILVCQSILLAVVILLKGDFVYGLLTLGANILFVLIFVQLYMKNKLKS